MQSYPNSKEKHFPPPENGFVKSVPASAQVPDLYSHIIEDVIANMRETYIDEGVDEQVLIDIKNAWAKKILEMDVLYKSGFVKINDPGQAKKNATPLSDVSNVAPITNPGNAQAQIVVLNNNNNNNAQPKVINAVGVKRPSPTKTNTEGTVSKIAKIIHPNIGNSGVARFAPNSGMIRVIAGGSVNVQNQTPTTQGARTLLQSSTSTNSALNMGQARQPIILNATSSANGSGNGQAPIVIGGRRLVILNNHVNINRGQFVGQRLINIGNVQQQQQQQQQPQQQQQHLLSPTIIPQHSFARTNISVSQLPDSRLIQIRPMESANQQSAQEQVSIKTIIPGKKPTQVDGIDNEMSSGDEDDDGDDDEEFTNLDKLEKSLLEDADIDADDDVVEPPVVDDEEPLNSGDDVSDDDDVAEVFDTDNLMVCQFDKISRSRNRWKFQLIDGIMNMNGKDYIFQRSLGEAEW